jgi:glyoxylase-like metal-dependent hydrolase (beta-lactamase superfamily II)
MRKTATWIVSMTMSGAVIAQDADLSWEATEVAPGIYMFEGQGGFTGGNLGLLVGDDGIVLIDDGIPEVSAATLAAVDAVIGAPPDFLINTHAHGDHTGSNHEYRGMGTTVLAHDNLRQALVDDENFPRSGLPELTFNDSVTFHLNGQTAYIFHIPSAHTSGDSAIHFTEANVLHTGDVLFNRIFPFIDIDGGGSLDGYIAGQQRMLGMIDDETTVIPGHGPLADKADLQAALDMLIDAQARVQALVDDGMSLDEVKAANPLAPYESWSWGFITTERMTETLYRSLAE